MVIAASVSYTPLYISVHAVSFSLDPDWLLDLPGFPTSDVMNHLVVAVILSRLDYCNSLVAGLLWSTVAPLQRVQNAAAWLVLGLSSRDHVSQALIDLHWLPVHYRIQYKLALMMYMAHTGQTTSYIKDAVTPISQDPTRRRLQSAVYPVPRTQTQFGESILCGGWTVHMELSPRVSEKDWLYSRLLNTVWKRTFQRLPRLCCVLIFFTVLLTVVMPGRSGSLLIWH